MVLEAVWFDLDGTLIEFQINYPEIKEELIQFLQITKYPVVKMHQERYVLRLLKDIEHFLFQEGWDASEINSLLKKADDIIASHEQAAARQAQLIPGMDQIVQELYDSGIKLGILTLNTTQNTLLSLESVGLTKYFSRSEWIIGRDQTPNTKPHFDHGAILLKRMHLTPKSVCIIGDHPTDIDIANNLNCRSIALLNGNYSRDLYQTPYLISKSSVLPDLKQLINSFLSENSK